MNINQSSITMKIDPNGLRQSKSVYRSRTLMHLIYGSHSNIDHHWKVSCSVQKLFMVCGVEDRDGLDSGCISVLLSRVPTLPS